jgi:hypothetical protein
MLCAAIAGGDAVFAESGARLAFAGIGFAGFTALVGLGSVILELQNINEWLERQKPTPPAPPRPRFLR